MQNNKKNGNQEPAKKKTVIKVGKFDNIHTGSAKTNPGVLKAQADKKKADANLASYKVKSDSTKAAVLKKAQKK
jgi:FAD synthase